MAASSLTAVHAPPAPLVVAEHDSAATGRLISCELRLRPHKPCHFDGSAPLQGCRILYSEDLSLWSTLDLRVNTTGKCAIQRVKRRTLSWV